MFFAYERAKRGIDFVFVESYVYAKAILSFLSVASKEDAEIIKLPLLDNQGNHSDGTLQKFSRHDEDFTSNDPIYNFYHDTFRENLLFNGLESGAESSVNITRML
jgi:predicted NACHT family NTPase